MVFASALMAWASVPLGYCLALLGWRVSSLEVVGITGQHALYFALNALPLLLAYGLQWAGFDSSFGGRALLAGVCVYLLQRTYIALVRGPEPVRQDLRGKVYVVTGANSGIGKETARLLVLWGGTVVMACRNLERGEDARQDILKTTKAFSHRVKLLQLNLSDFDSVRAFPGLLDKAGICRLDCLILNAGLMMDGRKVAPNGVEATFLANHLGHFLLTNLLQDLIVATARQYGQARVVVLSSSIHKISSCQALLDDPNSERGYTMFTAYGKSKLANLLFANDLSRRLKALHPGITVNSLHPGNVNSHVTQNMNIVMRTLNVLFAPVLVFFRKTVRQGAFTSVYVATSPELEGVTAQYFNNCSRAPVSKEALNETAAAELYRVSTAMVEAASRKQE
eukprot:EG_transcript_9879